jgi:positive regulator of sigma E activity
VSPPLALVAGIVEREALLLAIRDLVVLVLVLAVGFWIAKHTSRKDGS